MAKITGGLLLSFTLASCAPVPVQPQPAAHPGSAGSVSSPASGIPPPSQIGGPQRGQYVWDKVMEGVFMGASIAGPYGAGVGLVFGGLMGLLTADAHYAQLNTQIQTEHAKDKELEAQLERELERQRALDTQVAMAGTPASQASVTPVVSKPAPASAEVPGAQKRDGIGAQASLGKLDNSPVPAAPGFKNVEVKDINQDGIPDLWVYYNPTRPGEIVRQEEDTNGDGRVDTWSTFADGKLARRELDSNGDGRPDVVYLYENEIIAVEERDEQGKGRSTFRAYYQNGRVVKVERDTDRDGKLDLWVYYDPEKNGEVALKEEKDLNGDGVADLWSFYENGQLVRRDLSAAGLDVMSKLEKRDFSLPPEAPEARGVKNDGAVAR
ncbi:MAG: hypothetical protein ACREQK_19720 [Candidatus Binatia bacterium]